MVARHTEEDSENLNEIEVYVRLLLRRRRGYPLWIPKPGDWLPLAYRQEGVRIGDVGILTEFGGFDYLFNVCLPADHPVNAGRVPEQFRQLQGIDIGDMTWSTEEYMPGSYVASNPSHFSQTKIEDSCANVPGVPEEVGVGMSFSSSATKGALLIVPEGGKRIDHQQYSKFYKYAAECARSWYTHVNGPLMARGVHNGALYLVTGCDKARAWGYHLSLMHILEVYLWSLFPERLRMKEGSQNMCSEDAIMLHLLVVLIMSLETSLDACSCVVSKSLFDSLESSRKFARKSNTSLIWILRICCLESKELLSLFLLGSSWTTFDFLE
ncbi:hypothetical protein BT96DRAFT_843768 [Gymnopus androsaceus JB14]|uniref:Uncharacterized protein n=1 Tax=Gymnopus androsaceus JB14 TaxID=1447944 RepID=A0A6A4GDK6_9AGAR|nr:hypothetical protein BT96DRAFT_843768 [Gymnopus androsaceus JB14]